MVTDIHTLSKRFILRGIRTILSTVPSVTHHFTNSATKARLFLAPFFVMAQTNLESNFQPTHSHMSNPDSTCPPTSPESSTLHSPVLPSTAFEEQPLQSDPDDPSSIPTTPNSHLSEEYSSEPSCHIPPISSPTPQYLETSITTLAKPNDESNNKLPQSDCRQPYPPTDSKYNDSNNSDVSAGSNNHILQRHDTSGLSPLSDQPTSSDCQIDSVLSEVPSLECSDIHENHTEALTPLPDTDSETSTISSSCREHSLPKPQPLNETIASDDSDSDTPLPSHSEADDTGRADDANLHLNSFMTLHNDDTKPTEQSVSASLEKANDTIRYLRQSRDALFSSVESLRILVASERAITVATKRKLSDVESNFRDYKKRSDNDAFSLCNELKAQLEEAQLKRVTVETNVSELQSRLLEKDNELQRLHDLHATSVSERRTALAELAELRQQLDRKDVLNQELSSRVQDESAKTNEATTTLESLQEQLQSLNKTSLERDELLNNVDLLEKEVEILKCTASENERQWESKLSEKNEDLRQLEQELNQESARVSEMKSAAQHFEILKAQATEWDFSSDPLACIQNSTSPNTNEHNQIQGDRKLSDQCVSMLLTATMSIMQKNETISKLRVELNDIFARESATKSSSTATMNELENVRDVLESTRGELSQLRDQSRKERDALTASQLEVNSLKDQIKMLNNPSVVECGGDDNPEFKSISEIHRLRNHLARAHEEINRLQQQSITDKSSTDEVESSSPCSIDSSTSGLSVGRHDFSKLSSLADLEEAANLSISRAKSKLALNAHPDSSQNDIQSPSSTTTERKLETTSEDAYEKLNKANAKILALQEALQILERDLETKVRECKAMESHIEDTLSPALASANKELTRKTSEFEAIKLALEERRAQVESEKDNLQDEVGRTTGNLNNTLVMLDSAQQRLNHAEEKVRQLEAYVEKSNIDKDEFLSTIKDLQEECSHRQISLSVLRDRLASVEGRFGLYQQQVVDLSSLNSDMEERLKFEKEGRSIAEQRASRKDQLIRELEKEYQTLVTGKVEAETSFTEISGKLRMVERHVEDLENALNETRLLMHGQAQRSSARDEENIRALKAMSDKLLEREQCLSAQNRALSNTQEKVSRLDSELTCKKEKLLSLENKISGLSRNSVEREGLLRKKGIHVKELEEEVYKLKSACSNAQNETDRKNQALEGMRSAIQEKVDSIVRIRNEKESLENRVKQMKEEITAEKHHQEYSKTVLLKVQNDLADVRKELKNSEHELQARTADAESLSLSLVEAQTAASNAEQLAEAKEMELVQKQSRVEELEFVLSSLEQKVDSLETVAEVNQMLKKKVDSLESVAKDNRSLKAKVSSLESIAEANHSLKKEVDSLKSMAEVSKSLKAKIETLESDAKVNRSLKENCAAKDDLLKTKEAELLRVIREKERLEAHRQAFESELDSHSRVKSELTQQIRNLEEEKSRVEKKLKTSELEAQEEIKSLKQGINANHSAVKVKEDIIRTLRERAEAHDNQRIELEKRVDELQRHVEVTVIELAKTKQELEVADGQVQVSSEKISALESWIVERDEEVNSLQREIAHLNEKIEDSPKNENVCTLLRSKELAVARLHEWCSFINRKLRAAEKVNSEREAQLVESAEVMKRLEGQLVEVQDALRKKELDMQQLTYMHELEVLQLTSRVETLRASLGSAEEMSSKKITDTLTRDAESFTGSHSTRQGEEKKQIQGNSRSLGLSAKLELAEFSSAARQGDRSADSGRLEQVCSVRFTLSGRGCPAANVGVYVVGGDVTLGQWDANRRIALRVVHRGQQGVDTSDDKMSSSDAVRECDLLVPASVVTWYKYIFDAPDGSIVWERGENRLLYLDGQTQFETNDEWRE